MDNLVKEYLENKAKEFSFPNWDNFCVFFLQKKNELPNGEYKGINKPYIDLYSMNWLKIKISEGGRNSFNYVELLKTYEKEKVDVINPITINFDLKGGKNRLKDGK